ncbi:hypothetical protein IJ531_01145, partial [bacterium]|nr:hypothetical protein [bacterium]
MGITDAIKNAASAVKDKVESAASKVGAAVSNAATTVKNTVTSAASSVASTVGSIFTKDDSPNKASGKHSASDNASIFDKVAGKLGQGISTIKEVGGNILSAAAEAAVKEAKKLGIGTSNSGNSNKDDKLANKNSAEKNETLGSKALKALAGILTGSKNNSDVTK